MSATTKPVIVAFVLAIAGAIASYLVAGATLGLFIGSIAFTALIAPPLTLAVSQRSHRLIVGLAIVAGNVLVWVVPFPIIDCLRCGLILLAFTAAMVAISHVLQSVRIFPAVTT